MGSAATATPVSESWLSCDAAAVVVVWWPVTWWSSRDVRGSPVVRLCHTGCRVPGGRGGGDRHLTSPRRCGSNVFRVKCVRNTQVSRAGPEPPRCVIVSHPLCGFGTLYAKIC